MLHSSQAARRSRPRLTASRAASGSNSSTSGPRLLRDGSLWHGSPRRSRSEFNPLKHGRDSVKWREFITLLGGVSARASRTAARRCYGATPEGYASPMASFRENLGEAGYSEGQNVTIEFRWAEGRLERLPKLAADLHHCP